MFGTLLERMFVSIQADLSGLNDELRQSSENVGRFTQNVSSKFNYIGRSMMGVGTRMTAGVTLPLGNVGWAAIQSASDVEEMTSKFNVVFGELADETAAWAETHARAVNRSKFDLMSYASVIQDTFVPLGFARDEAAEMSRAVSELAIDLASFNNIAEETTIRDLQSALVGNHETMRKYGVVITQATLDQELMNMGIEGGTRAATEQQKALARLNVIVAGTSDAQGDAARTSNSFANQMRGFQSTLREVGVTIGQIMIPALTEIISHVQEGLQWFQQLDPEMQQTAVIIGVVAAAAGPLIIALGALAVAIGALLSPVGLVVVAIAALGAAWLLWGDDIKRVTMEAFGFVANQFTMIKDTVTAIWTEFTDGITAIWDNTVGWLMSSTQAVTESIQGAWQWLGDTLVGHSIIPDMIDKIIAEFKRGNSAVENLTDSMAKNVSNSFNFAANDSLRVMGRMAGEMSGLFGQLFDQSKGAAIAQAILNAYQGITRTLAQYPWPMSGILAGLHAAAALKQIANIRATNQNTRSMNTSGLSGGGGAGAGASVPDVAQSLFVSGISPQALFTGEGVRDLAEKLLDFQANGGIVVLED